MHALRAVLTATVVAVLVGALPLGVVAQTDGDDAVDATAEPPAEVTPFLVYATGRAPDAESELRLSLRHPVSGGEDAPMVIDVGVSGVDAQALAERGVAVFSMLYPDRWPEVERDADPTAVRAMAEAVACAVRFARGSEYGSETAPLVLAGFSRHAGLAAHVGLAGEDFDRLWAEYEEAMGAPPVQYDCSFSEASTRVDGLAGVAGTYDIYVGYEGLYGRDFLLEHEPELWELLWSTVALHPELRVRLLHGDADTAPPPFVSADFEAVLAEAGHDVELIEFAGGHEVPRDLLSEAVLELIS